MRRICISSRVAMAQERQQHLLPFCHNIPDEVVERRYVAGIRNLFNIYLEMVDEAMIFDNSEGKHELIAEKSGDSAIIALSFDKYQQFKQSYEKTT
jgi:predicted ABC-type ATPase